jgi:hypothetical protein
MTMSAWDQRPHQIISSKKSMDMLALRLLAVRWGISTYGAGMIWCSPAPTNDDNQDCAMKEAPAVARLITYSIATCQAICIYLFIGDSMNEYYLNDPGEPSSNCVIR